MSLCVGHSVQVKFALSNLCLERYVSGSGLPCYLSSMPEQRRGVCKLGGKPSLASQAFNGKCYG